MKILLGEKANNAKMISPKELLEYAKNDLERLDPKAVLILWRSETTSGYYASNLDREEVISMCELHKARVLKEILE